MADKFYLNDSDKRLLQASIRAVNQKAVEGQRYPNSFPDSPTVDTNAAPEMYVALTLETITAATIYNLEIITPGFGQCEVHYLNRQGDEKFSKVASLVHTVYNVSTTEIPIGTWIKIWKDKFGTWVTETLAVSASGNVGDVIGPESAQTGQIAFFSDPNGRFIANAGKLYYQEYSPSRNAYAASLPVYDTYISRLVFLVPRTELDATKYDRNSPASKPHWTAETRKSRTDHVAAGVFPAGTSPIPDARYEILEGVKGQTPTSGITSSYDYTTSSFLENGNLSCVHREIVFVGSAVGTVTTFYSASLGKIIEFTHSNIQKWRRYYAEDGAPGVGGQIPGGFVTNGIVTQLMAAPSGYTATSGSVTKTISPTSTLSDIRDVLANLINDLKTMQVIS